MKRDHALAEHEAEAGAGRFGGEKRGEELVQLGLGEAAPTGPSSTAMSRPNFPSRISSFAWTPEA